jgi:hypothetical protein
MKNKKQSAFAKATARQSKTNKQKGLAILYAVIVSIIMLSVATSISSIALRQTKLSSTGRESQYAFFAANTGIECARYWDLQSLSTGVAFPTSTDSFLTTLQMKCNEETINDLSNGWSSNRTKDNATTEFKFKLTPDIGKEYLVKVTVFKTSTSTLITSRGFNTADENAPNAVQRGLEMFYGY